MKFDEMIGKTFGNLTVVEWSGRNAKKERLFMCECSCGNTVTVPATEIRRGKRVSCGCRKHTHWESRGSRLYRIWKNMKYRCCSPRRHDYKYYGGRGIQVCEEWMGSYEAFRDWAWANGYSENLTIDRINNNGNYEPGNCRWATMKEQASNRRTKEVTHDDRHESVPLSHTAS